MVKARFIVLSNPTSPENEDAYNRWYNDTHAAEVVALPGIASMTRYRALAQVASPSEASKYQYLAVYDLDDPELALKSMAENASSLDMSGPLDVEGCLAIAFVPFFTYNKKPPAPGAIADAGVPGQKDGSIRS